MFLARRHISVDDSLEGRGAADSPSHVSRKRQETVMSFPFIPSCAIWEVPLFTQVWKRSRISGCEKGTSNTLRKYPMNSAWWDTVEGLCCQYLSPRNWMPLGRSMDIVVMTLMYFGTFAASNIMGDGCRFSNATYFFLFHPMCRRKVFAHSLATPVEGVHHHMWVFCADINSSISAHTASPTPFMNSYFTFINLSRRRDERWPPFSILHEAK